LGPRAVLAWSAPALISAMRRGMSHNARTAGVVVVSVAVAS
jgi:hypothetical protein